MLPDESFAGSPTHWLRYALSDLELACAKPSHVLLEMLCFHAQQAVEKVVKAVLLAQGVDFPKTHNLRVLFDLLAEQLANNRNNLATRTWRRYVEESGRFG
ncbi:MAG TPA: HEPN domain-containing protein [Candidatus Brocadiaceae bacterium]|nr:HEPN domain-containing protein [Candidatus Brocadiaceae bacterium]